MEDKSQAGRIPVLFKALATLGPAWAIKRAHIALWNKFGVLERRLPLHSWDDVPLIRLLKSGVPSEINQYFEWRQKNSTRFFFEGFSAVEAKFFVGENSIKLADSVLGGIFPFFGYTQNLGFPPEWQRNPLNCARAPRGHWSKINEFAFGDIKLWWEASRFSWVFALGRAYTRTREERYAEAFWQLFESWLEQNPPQCGINWKCGQEASFRAMALCFGFHVFTKSPSSTAPRVARFLVAMAVHAKRIDAYIEYALSQKNNHGISEGTGIWTIGLLFPELQGANGWRVRGKQIIEREVRRQIYADGGYIQHSINYHRVMLHDLAWAIRLGECNGDHLGQDVYDSFRKSILFLHGLTDEETGWAPNYGANDGALVLPLSDCAYPDMRPVLQCCYFIAEKERLYDSGPWDEEMVWLNSLESLKVDVSDGDRRPVDRDASVGGCHTIRLGDSWIMLKGTNYKDRPSHADQLHIDLWWRGENVICDSGSYSYNAEAPFDHAFTLTRFHNTVVVDSADQMTRLSRFLWVDWANAGVRRYENPSTGMQVLEGEHDGYTKVGVNHRRAVTQAARDIWIVVDDLTGHEKHNLRLRWLTPDVPFDVVSSVGLNLKLGVNLEFNVGKMQLLVASSSESKFDLVRAGKRIIGEDSNTPDLARGWLSRFYGCKTPALSFGAESNSFLPVRFITVIALGRAVNVKIAPFLTNIKVDSSQINLSAIGGSTIFPG